MGLFREYKMHWWQVGILKITLLVAGILIGAHWPSVFETTVWLTILWIVFVLGVTYLLVTLQQQKK